MNNDWRDYELAHHGILGMKWGQRNGPPYPLTSKTRSADENRSRRKGKSKTDSIKTFISTHKKEIIIGSAAAASVLALYGGYSIYKGYGLSKAFRTYGTSDLLTKTLNSYPKGDFTIRKNSKLQRVSSNPVEDFSKVGSTYVSYKFRDNQRYKSGFVNEVNVSGAKNFVHKLKPQKDMKIASPKTVAEIYLKLHPNEKDQTFRFVTSPYSFNDKYSNDSLSKTISKRRRELYAELVKLGYSGFVDIEDASKAKGSSPLIIINPSANINTDSVHSLGKVESIIAQILK